MHPAPGAIVGGKYRLEAPLSRGGMSALWVARHLQLGSPVAIKLMDPEHAASPAYRTRFAREAQAAANLVSPHIVRVQDFGVEDDTPYLVMELLEGEDLHERLERCGRLSLAEASHLLAQAGKGLRRAHEAGIVHRDLNTRNVFLARDDDDEIVKILDFGIAKQTGARVTGATTRAGELLGTPEFMSPEQIREARDLDARSDLWSLAVILFRAVTGRLPFDGAVMSTLIVKILVDPLPRASQIAPDLPAALDAFFARALARDRDQRFATVQEMVVELARIAGAPQRSQPPSSAPPPEAPPAPQSHRPEVLVPRPARRRGAILAIAVLAVAGGVASLALLRGAPGNSAEATPAAGAPTDRAPDPAESAAATAAPTVEITPAGAPPEPAASGGAEDRTEASSKPPAKRAAPQASGAHARPAATAEPRPRPAWGF